MPLPQIAIHGAGDVHQGSNSFGSITGAHSAFFQGGINNSNIHVTIDAQRSNGGANVKVQGSGDPLSILQVIAASLEAVQEVFDNHPEIETIWYSSGDVVGKGKDGKDEAKGQFATHMHDCCLRYGQQAKDANSQLDKMKQTKDTKGSIRKLASATASAIWNDRKVAPLKGRLEQICGDLRHYLKHCLTDESSETKKFLDQLLTKLKSRDNEPSEDRRRSLETARDRLVEGLSATSPATSRDILQRLRELSDESVSVGKECSIIESLAFPGIHERELSMEAEHESTNEWAFEDEYNGKPIYLRDWLESGDNIFWVKGHPGSGKSTFMRYVANHDRTVDALQAWAADDNLITCKYFFWLADGSLMQTTREGLLRSLLFSIFCNNPSLMHRALPQQRRGSITGQNVQTSWTLSDLHETLRRTVEDAAQNTKFCFFVDGLDEYQGQQADSPDQEMHCRDIASELIQIASWPNVKICTSSRSRRAFEERWGGEGNAHRVLRMQDYTIPDIEVCIGELLEADVSFQHRKKQNPEFDELAGQLAKKAEGVWLWARCAVRHVCLWLENGKGPEEIRAKVDELPDLDGLYERDLQDIPDDCKQQAAQIFLMSLHANEPIPIVTLILAGYFTDHSSTALFELSDSVFNKTQLEAMLKEPSRSELRRNEELGDWTGPDIEKAIQNKQEALEARCQDFLKIRRSTGHDKRAHSIRDRLVFPHRTCRDFLQRKHAQGQDVLWGIAGDTFKINEALLKAISLHVHLAPKVLNCKGITFAMLLRNILYCAAQHQLSRDDMQASSLEWIPDVNSGEFSESDFVELAVSPALKPADVDIDDKSDTSSISSTETSKRSSWSWDLDALRDRWTANIDEWDKQSQDLRENGDADLFQQFIKDPIFYKTLLTEKASPRRKSMRDACLKLDKSTSLWTAMHLVPELILLTESEGKGLNDQRGRSSIWSCWIQMLWTARANQRTTDLNKELSRLTVMLIENGANPNYVLRHQITGEEITARTLIQGAFGREYGDALVVKALKRRKQIMKRIMRGWKPRGYILNFVY